MATLTLTPYLASLRRTRLLDPLEERALAAAARAGDPSALERLVRANLPFVLKVAKQYRGRGVPFEDLVAEGNLGLLEAAPRYDGERGIRFITYAMWWIRKRILHALETQARTVRVPGQPWECRRNGAGEKPVRTVEVPLERLPDASVPHAESDLVHREAVRRVRAAVAALSAQQRRVLQHRFGLGEHEPLTLRETGERLRVSRERVRQIEEQAIARLRRCLRYPPARDPAADAAPAGSAPRQLAV